MQICYVSNMSDASSRLLKTAEARSVARRVNEEVIDYEQVAELFRRFTDLDIHSIGPELARLQSLARAVPPQPIGLRGKIRGLFFRIMNPVLGRVLRAASLASPFQAAYELAMHLQQQQLETERRILTEISTIGARLEILESEVWSRRFSG
jgi:hypothetical protein